MQDATDYAGGYRFCPGMDDSDGES